MGNIKSVRPHGKFPKLNQSAKDPQMIALKEYITADNGSFHRFHDASYLTIQLGWIINPISKPFIPDLQT